MLQFRYGNYRFDAGAVQFSTQAERQYSTRGNPVSIRKTMDMSYDLVAGSTRELTQRINDLIDALVPGYDLGLYEQNGSPTVHVWRNNQAFGGIRVVSDASPVGDGTEYVTSRTISIRFEADFPIVGLDPILSFSESVTIVGTGGPVEVYIPLLKGKWQKQQVAEKSLVTASQSGEIVIWGKRPTLSMCPKPIWPSFEVVQARQFTQVSGDRRGNSIGEYRASYSYSYQSNEPLIGFATDL